MAKILLSGLPAIGKTTLLQTLTDVLVFARDGKQYPFPQPHVNVPDFTSVDELIQLMGEKITAYKDKFGTVPKTIVIDSISKILLDIEGNILSTVKSFPYGVINTEIKKFVDFLERDLAPNVNLIMVSHSIWDEDTGSFKLVNAGGSWGKKGGMLSEVDQAVYLEYKGNRRIIHHRNPKLAARTTLPELPDSQPAEEYDLQKHVELLNEVQTSHQEFVL